MIIGIIPARKGSKRIKNKNTKLLNGKPLIEYTIIEVKKSKLLNKILISTDCPIIKKISRMNGINIPKLRSKKLSSANIKMLPVLKDALIINNLKKKAKIIVLLQPTSPLRKAEHIDGAIKIFNQKKADTLVSVCYTNKIPSVSKIMIENNGYLRLFNKNKDKYIKGRKYLIRNGPAVFITKASLILKNKLYGKKIIPFKMQNKFSVDINYHKDFYYPEKLIKKYE